MLFAFLLSTCLSAEGNKKSRWWNVIESFLLPGHQMFQTFHKCLSGVANKNFACWNLTGKDHDQCTREYQILAIIRSQLVTICLYALWWGKNCQCQDVATLSTYSVYSSLLTPWSNQQITIGIAFLTISILRYVLVVAQGTWLITHLEIGDPTYPIHVSKFLRDFSS